MRPAAPRSLGAARAVARCVTARQPKLAIVLVLALIGQQFIVSLLRIEASPVLSTYDMYSTTYGSPADYEHKAGQAYWIVGLDVGRNTQVPHQSDEADAIAGGFAGDRSSDRSAPAPLLRSLGPISNSVSVEATRVHVDWAQWRLLDEPIRTSLTDP